MSRWVLHHMDLVFAAGIVGVAAIVGFAFGRLWWLLLPAPALLAAFAWLGWEYSSEAAPFVIAIAVLGYAGLGVGGTLARARRRRRARPV